MQSDLELELMAAIAKAHAAGLEAEAIGRVLRWAGDRYKAIPAPKTPLQNSSVGDEQAAADSGDIASFFHAVNPQSNADRALAIAYWFQIKQGQSDFGAQDVNTALKHLGHGVTNITETLRPLMAQSPHLVIQKQKMGNTKQARKRYMVTSEGKKYVEQLMATKQD